MNISSGSLRIGKNILLLSEKALILEKHTLVIADLHLGYEGIMATSGLFLPRVQLDDTINRINDIIDKHSVKNIVICGDLKHEFSQLHRFEWKDIEKFVLYLKQNFEKVMVVRGNHDNYLKILLKKHDIPFHEDVLIIDEVLFVHGDRDVDVEKKEVNVVVMGHEHPAMSVKDSLGVAFKIPCFLVGKYKDKKVIVLPAFSDLFVGVDVLSVPNDGFLSPILKKAEVDEFKIYACLDNEILEFPEIKSVREHASRF